MLGIGLIGLSKSWGQLSRTLGHPITTLHSLWDQFIRTTHQLIEGAWIQNIQVLDLYLCAHTASFVISCSSIHGQWLLIRIGSIRRTYGLFQMENYLRNILNNNSTWYNYHRWWHSMDTQPTCSSSHDVSGKQHVKSIIFHRQQTMDNIILKLEFNHHCWLKWRFAQLKAVTITPKAFRRYTHFSFVLIIKIFILTLHFSHHKVTELIVSLGF